MTSKRIEQIKNTKHNLNRYFKLIDSLNNKVDSQVAPSVKQPRNPKIDDILHRFRIKTEDIQLTPQTNIKYINRTKDSKNSLRS
jgi:hypothetical protein